MTLARLQPIVDSVARRAAERRAALPLDALRRQVVPDQGCRKRFVAALAAPGLSLITECKRRSPSAGALAAGGPGEDLVARAQAYRAGGAAALSVLTEQDHFAGSPEDLRSLCAVGLPVLRKDFVLDEGMLLESRLWGADAVLLLVVLHEPTRLAELAALAREIGLATLIEVHDEAELDVALAADPDALGINARDLTTFEVDLGTVERLLPRVPEGPLRVAESGLAGPGDLARVRAAGADAGLVGEALMRSSDPQALLQSWKEVCRD